jgi:pimeloyl-ACP methyl ester carboxylesterase
MFRRTLLTDDGIRLEAAYHEGTAGDSGVAVVLAHGFTGALDRPALRRAADVFAEAEGVGGVVTFSFRGHGRSSGASTVGDREVLDVDAAVRWARRIGHDRVATVGFSMGGSVVLRHAAKAEDRPTVNPVDAVVSVSAPARWYYRGTAPMRRVNWAITRPVGRVVARYGLRTRIHGAGWDPVPRSPVEVVHRIRPTPLLIVHGDQDGYFPLDHPLSLERAAGGAAELWIERGFGHAENAAEPRLLHRIGSWLTASVARGPAAPGAPQPPGLPRGGRT